MTRCKADGAPALSVHPRGKAIFEKRRAGGLGVQSGSQRSGGEARPIHSPWAVGGGRASARAVRRAPSRGRGGQRRACSPGGVPDGRGTSAATGGTRGRRATCKGENFPPAAVLLPELAALRQRVRWFPLDRTHSRPLTRSPRQRAAAGRPGSMCQGSRRRPQIRMIGPYRAGAEAGPGAGTAGGPANYLAIILLPNYILLSGYTTCCLPFH